MLGGDTADFIAIDLEQLKENEINKRIDLLKSIYPEDADRYEEKVKTDRMIKNRFIESQKINAALYQDLPGETLLRPGMEIPEDAYELVLDESFCKFYRKINQ